MKLLDAQDLTVRFGGLTALDGVSLHVEEAQLAGVMGPNGAGKSTLMSVLSGQISSHEGRIEYAGRNLRRLAPHRRARLGIARTFQRLELWGSLTVRGNILTAAEIAKAWRPDTDPPRVADALIERLGLSHVADSVAKSLPTGLARVTEVARALASSPRLLLLDEPSAGLDDTESRQLSDALVRTAAEGTAILLVEHHVDMLMQACSYLWVLDFGQLIAHGTPAEVRGNAAVQDAYLGSRNAARA